MNIELSNIPLQQNPQPKIKQPISFADLQQRIETLGSSGVVNVGDANTLIQDIQSNKDNLQKQSAFDGATEYENLLVKMLSVVDQKKDMDSTHEGQIDTIKNALQDVKSGLFNKVENSEAYFEKQENKVFKNNTSQTQHKPQPNSTIKAFNKELTLQNTVTDGNCGVDAIKQATGDTRSLEEIRSDIATKCDNARRFCNLTGGVKESNIDNQQQNILNLLELCYKDFATFKNLFIGLSQETRDGVQEHGVKLTETLNKSNDWSSFQQNFKNTNIDHERVQILHSIMSQMPLMFDQEFSLLNGVGRNNIADDGYKDLLADKNSKIWLDFQEIKTYLGSQGFKFCESKDLVNPKGVAFKFINSEDKEIILFLNNVQLGDHKNLITQSDRSNHWQYLTSVKAR